MDSSYKICRRTSWSFSDSEDSDTSVLALSGWSSVMTGGFLPPRFCGVVSTGFQGLPVVPETIILSALSREDGGGALPEDVVVDPDELEDKDPNFPMARIQKKRRSCCLQYTSIGSGEIQKSYTPNCWYNSECLNGT